ncbi:DUF2946 domain-containing protein [Castellaniella sp. MT123]|uniref:DUF2946 domain-containing protein n=1 Tax=Castellaniella sp. MT123 TaxID=3140381 RepID=UPI0031F3584F
MDRIGLKQKLGLHRREFMVISVCGKRVSAWLGIIAMLLLVCAPTVSHFMHATRSMTLPLCTVAQFGHSSAAITVSVSNAHDTDHGADSHLLDDCGYCHLLQHDAVLPSVSAGSPPVLWLFILALVLLPARCFTPIGAFPAGRPRAPPVFSHS